MRIELLKRSRIVATLDSNRCEMTLVFERRPGVAPALLAVVYDGHSYGVGRYSMNLIPDDVEDGFDRIRRTLEERGHLRWIETSGMAWSEP